VTATFEEWFQWFIPGRVGTMEDVFLNWVAIVCGLLFSIGLDPVAFRPAEIGKPPGAGAMRARAFAPGSRSLRHCGAAAALFVLVFGMFFDSVHLGHRIDDARIGSFTSIYTAAELAALARDRASRWKTNPPVDRTRLAREDQYRTEGIQHVQERNEAWERGDVDVAWREHLILEIYYVPVLHRGHEWPADQRADASNRAAGAPITAATFVSHAYPYEVYTWPSPPFWGLVLALAAGLLSLTWRAAARMERAIASV
jgi:hypothetical protein